MNPKPAVARTKGQKSKELDRTELIMLTTDICNITTMNPELIVAQMVSKRADGTSTADPHHVNKAVEQFVRLRHLTQCIENTKDYPPTELQKRILEFGLDYHALMYAKSTPGADIAALQELALTTDTNRKMYGDEDGGEIAYDFAGIDGADKKACEKRILEVGSADMCLKFALNVPGADVEALHARVKGMREPMDRGSWGDILDQLVTILSFYNTNQPKT